MGNRLKMPDDHSINEMNLASDSGRSDRGPARHFSEHRRASAQITR